MEARANQKAALEPVNAVLKGKPHVFESWSDFIIIIISIDQLEWYLHYSVSICRFPPIDQLTFCILVLHATRQAQED